MLKSLTTLPVLLVCLFGATACTSHSHGGAPQALHASSDQYVGTYSGASGQTVTVRQHGDGFVLETDRGGQTRSYDGYVLNIDGVSVWEITMADPAAATDSEGRPVVPTYMYGRTERKGDEVTFRRLRTEWLEQQAKGMSDAAFGLTPQIAEGSGAIVVRHPAAVESMLRKGCTIRRRLGMRRRSGRFSSLRKELGMPRNWRNRRIAERLIVAPLLTLATAVLSGHGVIPRDTPVDRLVANLGKYIKEHPDEPEGYYRLGRVHTLALERKSGFVPAFSTRGELEVPAEGSWAHDNWTSRDESDAEHAKPTRDDLKAHLAEAVKSLNKAIELRPNVGKYRLTLACALEAGKPYRSEMECWPLCPRAEVLTPASEYDKESVDWLHDQFFAIPAHPDRLDELLKRLHEPSAWQPSTRDVIVRLAYDARDRDVFKDAVKCIHEADWDQQVEDQFYTAMCLSLPADSRATEKPIWGGLEDWTSYEAAKDFLRVVEGRKPRSSDDIRLKTAKSTIKAFDELAPPQGITPIVLSFSSCRGIADLISPTSKVQFDLDGSGRSLRWGWVRPDTALLVWDPLATGSITSGRQLFGNASWWVLFENGYDALDALDDNRDGRLCGDELRGIALWFDRDGNGVSGSDEVVPIQAAGISSLATHASSVDEGCPMNPRGVALRDGRVLATFDWIARPNPTSPAFGANESR